MSNYSISYNPYQNTTKVVKNGTMLRNNCSLCKGINGKRLQAWFDVEVSWNGFGKALDIDNNESVCNIEFSGREIDFIDLKEYFENIYVSEKGTIFNLTSKNLSNDDDLLEKLIDFVEKEKQDGIFDDAQIASIERYINEIKATPFVISVIATMSSGKSTLLNSLMHMELLPTGDDATTANIVEIFDNDKKTIEYAAYDKDNNMVCKGTETDLETLTKINENQNIRTVRIYGDIPGVSADRMQLMLRDTPGPNNSQDLHHKDLTESIISDAKNMSTVIYVMNATQMRVDSDQILLSSIAYEMKEGGKQANDRFLFVINKVDLRLKKPNQTLEKLIEETKNYLLTFGIENPRIFPVTAGLACDIWKYRSGYEFDKVFEWPDVEKNVTMFNADSPRVKFDLYSSISPCVRRQLNEDLEKALCEKDIYEVALIHSGIKGLEYSIKEYMEKYAYPIKVSDAVKDIKDTIDEKRMTSKFMDILLEDEKKLKEARAAIGNIEQKKAERLAAKENFENEIRNYSLPEDTKKEARQSVENAFTELIDKTMDKLTDSKIKREDADSIVSTLADKTVKIEKKLDEDIKEMIHNAVCKKGRDILEAYQDYVQQLKENMSINDFDFERIKELKKLNFDSLKAIANTVTSTENITEKDRRPVRNPKKHWYTPWRRSTIWEEYDKIVETVEYVDTSALKNEILSVKINAGKNVDEIVEEANELVKSFQEFFILQLSKFESVIEVVISDLSKAISEEQIMLKTKEEHEDNLEKLGEYIDRINRITEMEEEL